MLGRKTRLQQVGLLLARLHGRVIVVEGKRDVAALEELGVKARFVQAHGNNGKLVEKISIAAQGGTVVLLFDFDAEGKRKEAFFKTLLEENGVRTDSLLARKLRAALLFNSVEEAASKFEKLEEKGELNGKNVH